MVLIKALRIDTTCNHSKNFLTGNLNDCFYFGCKKGIGTINNYYWWVGKIVKEVNMKSITRQMIKIYNLKEHDFMGYKLVKDNATYHHLIKKENGGKETIDNGAILMPVSHQYLHIIEFKEFNIYDAVNKIMTICNKKGCIEKEDLVIISELLKMFEKEHIKDKTSKGKSLIRYQHLDRIYR